MIQQKQNQNTVLRRTVFNTQKTLEEYKSNKVFLTGKPALLNTIHKAYPDIWQQRDELKSLDWHENEFNYSTCLNEFKTYNDVSNAMIDTLAWQWESDSIASTNPLILIAPFQPCLEVFAMESQVTANEILHSATYSEIVRLSFEDPEKVLADILENQESFRRLDVINKKFGEFQEFSIDYSLNKHNYPNYTDEFVLAKLIEFYFCLLVLERVQFIASFAITFTIVHSGLFQPIGNAVRKIAQDELQCHVKYRKSVILALCKQLNIPISNFSDTLIPIIDEIVESELEWSKHLLGKYSIAGLQLQGLQDWVKYNANDVYHFVTGEVKYPECVENPLPFLSEYFDNDSVQSAVQEIQSASYVMNSVIDDGANVDFELMI